MTDYHLRKRLAKKGFLFDGLRFTFEDDEKMIQNYLKSGAWKMPRKPKRIKLTDF